MRKAAWALLLFAVDVDEMVDRDFQLAAQKASDAGQTETLQFCKRWLGVTTPEEYERYAAEDQVFRDQDLDPLYKTFEYFVFLKRVRPAIFTPRARPRRGANRPVAAGGAPRTGSQAALEDAGDRCFVDSGGRGAALDLLQVSGPSHVHVPRVLDGAPHCAIVADEPDGGLQADGRGSQGRE